MEIRSMKIKDKTVLITGASGLVGVPTVERCLRDQAGKVIAVDIKFNKQLRDLQKQFPDRLTVLFKDLTYLDNCEDLFRDKIHIVLHLAGIKGNPNRAKHYPADYLLPMVMFNTNMIKTSFDAGVDWFVYTSSVGVYEPSESMLEDDVWKTMPSQNDWYPGWSKRMGELTIESLAIQHQWKNWSIIRPSNIYGPNDNISLESTVIGSNVWKVFNSNDNTIECWGDGSPKRDFVYSNDVADAIVDVVQKEINDIINFGCGNPVSIKDTIDIILDLYEEITGQRRQPIWDTSKPNGDMLRSLNIGKQTIYNILPKTNLRDGIKTVLLSYQQTRQKEFK